MVQVSAQLLSAHMGVRCRDVVKFAACDKVLRVRRRKVQTGALQLPCDSAEDFPMQAVYANVRQKSLYSNLDFDSQP